MAETVWAIGMTRGLGSFNPSWLKAPMGRSVAGIIHWKAQLQVIWVGGVGGGWDTPARDMYPRLAKRLQSEGIASLRIRFRNPRVLEMAVDDVLAGIPYLESRNIRQIGLVGHSFGGAVVIQAAALSKMSRTVVTIATQSYGGEAVVQLPEGCSILLLHGENDNVLPDICSRQLFDIAMEPKRLILYPGNDHCLNQSSEDARETVYQWLRNELSGTGGAA